MSISETNSASNTNCSASVTESTETSTSSWNARVVTSNPLEMVGNFFTSTLPNALLNFFDPAESGVCSNPIYNGSKQKEEDSIQKIAKELFGSESKIPSSIQGLISEYIDYTPTVIIKLLSNSIYEIPNQLKSITFLDLTDEFLTFEVFESIINEFKNLKSIKLPTYADDLWIEKLSTCSRNLDSLDISGCKISDEAINRIFKELRLQELNLSDCVKITDNAFKNIQESSESLKKINLSYNNITDKGLEYISEGVKDLNSLKLYKCQKITDIGISFALDRFQLLEHLDLSSCLITDNGLANLKKIVKSLKSLDLYRCDKITGEFLLNIDQKFEVLKKFSFSGIAILGSNLIHLARNFPALENLKLSAITNLTDEVIIKALQGAKNITNLQLVEADIGDESLKVIANECPDLKTLSLIDCTNPIKSGIGAIFDGCKDLQSLCLNGMDIEDHGLEIIAEKPRNLKELILINCKKINDGGFKSISIGCPNLRSILLYSINITDDGILHLSSGIKGLQHLYISGSDSTSYKSCDYILKWKETLQSLSLGNCKMIDDEALTHFSPGFPILKNLTLPGNQNITSNGLRHFAEWFPCLYFLSLVGCKNIRDDALKYLKEIPMMSILSLGACGITDEGFRQIVDFPSLCELNLFDSSKVPKKEIDSFRDRGIKVCSYK